MLLAIKRGIRAYNDNVNYNVFSFFFFLLLCLFFSGRGLHENNTFIPTVRRLRKGEEHEECKKEIEKGKERKKEKN